MQFFRLIAEKINKNERKGTAEIMQFAQNKESAEFWKLIGGPPESMEVTVSYFVIASQYYNLRGSF